jgi:hypothetical protein
VGVSVQFLSAREVMALRTTIEATFSLTAVVAFTAVPP